MATETKTFYPGAYEDSTFTSVTNPTNPVGQGASNTTYAQLATSQSHGATHAIYWPFDLSAIPGDAEIDSVTCTAKIGNTASSYFSSLQGQLCSGTLAKGTSTEFKSVGSNGEAKTISAGAWTREELSAIRLKIYAVRQYNISGGGAYVRFYGADLTVTYTYQSEKFMLKLGGAWHDIVRVFKKVSGIWVEQTELANVIEDGVRYKNGGEIESTAPQTRTVTISGTGTTSNTSVECYVEIDGVKYTSATTIEVQPGTTMRCYGYGATVNITLNGAQVGTAVDGNSSKQEYTHTVNKSCTVNMAYTAGFASTATITITTG